MARRRRDRPGDAGSAHWRRGPVGLGPDTLSACWRRQPVDFGAWRFQQLLAAVARGLRARHSQRVLAATARGLRARVFQHLLAATAGWLQSLALSAPAGPRQPAGLGPGTLSTCWRREPAGSGALGFQRVLAARAGWLGGLTLSARADGEGRLAGVRRFRRSRSGTAARVGLMLIRLHGVRVRAPYMAVPRISCRSRSAVRQVVPLGGQHPGGALLGSLAAGVVATRVVAQA